MGNDPLSLALAYISARLARDKPELAAAYDHFVAALKGFGAGLAAPACGDVAPEFALPARDGSLISLSERVRSGPVVLSFFRGGWCDYCVAELDLLARHHADIHAAGGQIIAVSGEIGGRNAPEGPAGDLPFPVLCDADLGVAMAYGLLVRLNPELQKHYTKIGISFRTIYGNDSFFLAIPATFVIASDGRVIAAKADPDFRQRMPITEILAALQSAPQGLAP